MTIFGGQRGLSYNEAISTETGYILHLGHGEYLVNGQSMRGGKEIAVENIDDIQRVERSKHITHYEHMENGTEYDVETIKALRDKWDHHIDEDGVFFGSTEDELEYVKDKAVLRKVRPVYSDETVTKTPVEIRVVASLVDTQSDFIESAPSVGRAESVFSVKESSIAMDQCVRMLRESGVSYDIPTHSNLEFVKANGKYIFTNQKNTGYIAKTGQRKVFDSLEKAQAHEESIRSHIRKEINLVLDNSPASQATLSDVIGTLRKIRNDLRELDVKAKHDSKKRSLVNYTTKAVDDLFENLEANDE